MMIDQRRTMQRNRTKPLHQTILGKYDHPIISDSLHRDTLDRVADVMELLEQPDLSDGLTPSALAGLHWIHHMLVDATKHVSDSLRLHDKRSAMRDK